MSLVVVVVVVVAAAVAGTVHPSAGTYTLHSGVGDADAAAAEVVVQAEAVVERSPVAPAHTHLAAHSLAVRTLADHARLAAAAVGHSFAEAVHTVHTAPVAPGLGEERRIEPFAVLAVMTRARMH